MWQGLSLVCACVCARACVCTPRTVRSGAQSVEAVINNHLVIVFLDIVIKSFKLKLSLNSLLQKWRHVNCIWLCLQSSSISGRDTSQRQIQCSAWGYALEPVNTEPGHLWLNGLELRLRLELAQNHQEFKAEFLTSCQVEKLHWSSRLGKWACLRNHYSNVLYPLNSTFKLERVTTTLENTRKCTGQCLMWPGRSYCSNWSISKLFS